MHINIGNLGFILVVHLIGLLLGEGHDQPKLVLALMSVVLKDVVSSVVEDSVGGVSLDEVTLVSKRTLVGSGDLEPAAGMLVVVGNDLDAVGLVVLEDAEPRVVAGNHDSELGVLPREMELLRGLLLEVIDSQLVVLVDSKALVVVGEGKDLVGSVGHWLEDGRDIGVNWFLVGFNLLGTVGLDVVSWDDQPLLVDSSVEFPLTDLSVLVGLASLDVQGLPFSEGLDAAGLTSPLSSGHWHDLEEAAGELPSIGLDDSSIVAVFLLYMKSLKGRVIDEGVFVVVLEDLEELPSLAMVVCNGQLVGLILDGEGLVVVKSTGDLVGGLGVGGEEKVLLSLH